MCDLLVERVSGCTAVSVAAAVAVSSAFPGETGSSGNRAACVSGGMRCVCGLCRKVVKEKVDGVKDVRWNVRQENGVKTCASGGGIIEES